jgi:beta-lactam-binding protein with PASTA domain
VPRLAGKTLRSARQTLSRAHCRLGRVTLAYSKRIRRGLVIKQSPHAGRRLKNGGRVSVLVSRGRRR